jgi:hypothetical protein
MAEEGVGVKGAKKEKVGGNEYRKRGWGWREVVLDER